MKYRKQTREVKVIILPTTKSPEAHMVFFDETAEYKPEISLPKKEFFLQHHYDKEALAKTNCGKIAKSFVQRFNYELIEKDKVINRKVFFVEDGEYRHVR
jgi:hypothetical protein